VVDIAIQASWNSGEWSPNLYARVDLQKYRSGAALLNNFFVDYRGGASTRTGSAYVIQAYRSATPVRIIPFQSSFNAGYIVEIGNGYMRFMYHGQPVTEATFAITNATAAASAVLTISGHNYIPGDWIFVTGIVGMTQLNGRYFLVLATTASTVTIGYLNGGAINSTTFSAYISGGTAARIYTIPSPYTSADNFRDIKYAQSIGQMILVHPNHPVYVLSIASANNWTLVPATFGATVQPPTGVAVSSTIGTGTNWYYSYVVTAVDSSGQESSPSAAGTYASSGSIRLTSGTNTITWTASPGAVRYNVYEAEIAGAAAVVSGANYGFVGSATGVSFQDSNIAPDFSFSPPIAQNPFIGSPIASISVGTPGSYAAGTTAPTITFSGGSPILPATAVPQLGVLSASLSGGSSSGWHAGDTITLQYGIILQVATIGGGGSIASYNIVNNGTFSSGTLPATANAVATSNPSGVITGGVFSIATWSVQSVQVSIGGAYLTAPTVVFSSGAAVATATLSTTNGNPTAVGFVQQRLTLGGLTTYPATFYMSQPGNYFNFNISNPIVASDAIQATLVASSLNNIQSMVGVSAGMLVLTDQMAWLVNGGGTGTAITPSAIVANPQSFDGANDVPPIVLNYDVLMVGAKGSNVWDLAYNIYFSTFTSEDISVMSSHLFYGYNIVEWSWAEQPYYKASAIRSDGTLLSLTFLKQQQFTAWTHFTTLGSYKSTAAITEVLPNGTAVDATYVVVSRTINSISVQYIERFAERNLSNGISGAWTVDASVQYVGSGTLNFSGAEQLAAATVTGIAIDNLGNPSIIAPFVMPTTGLFTLPAPTTGGSTYTQVTIGLGFVCQLQTLPLDIDGPSIQGKTKAIPSVNIKIRDTLGLSIGSSFGSLVVMKDLVLGNVSSTLVGQPSQVVTGLVSGDAWTLLDTTYTVPGQYCIQASHPWPATVLGVFPRFVVEGSRSER
jgi:hypothetical protein